jgi:hypothetical protein
LVKDYICDNLQLAKARVSAGASRNAFKTNGMTRAKRRIDAASFSTWRLKHWSKDLDGDQ